eukprot:8200467-Pyramimonas_sp.AAC.1
MLKSVFITISQVRLYYREGFDKEERWMPMMDNGVWPDVAANDGVYSAALHSGLPGLEFKPGSMIRWCVAK